jgi:hypothetical protein
VADKSKILEDHYTQGKLLESILEFLQARGVDPQHPTCEDLFACDQLHDRAIIATREHFEHAGIATGMHVLDVGCVHAWSGAGLRARRWNQRSGLRYRRAARVQWHKGGFGCAAQSALI